MPASIAALASFYARAHGLNAIVDLAHRLLRCADGLAVAAPMLAARMISGARAMNYVTEWERLTEALNRVMEAGLSKEQAQIALGQAIADGVVKVRGKLKRRATTHMTASDTVLEGAAFHIPPKIGPRDLDFERSRPVKPWGVRRGTFETHRGSGIWSGSSFSGRMLPNAVCSLREQGRARTRASLKGGACNEQNTALRLSGAEQMIKLLYPDAIPGQATVPNAILCRRAGERLREWECAGRFGRYDPEGCRPARGSHARTAVPFLLADAQSPSFALFTLAISSHGRRRQRPVGQQRVASEEKST